MSKCKAVLDGDKITEIQVKVRAQKRQEDKLEPEKADMSKVKPSCSNRQSE